MLQDCNRLEIKAKTTMDMITINIHFTTEKVVLTTAFTPESILSFMPLMVLSYLSTKDSFEGTARF